MTAERLWLGAALLALGLALGCGDKDDTGADTGGGGTEDGGGTGDGGGSEDGGAAEVSWSTVEADLANSCAFSSCHGGHQWPDLSQGSSYASLVKVNSQQAPDQVLVVPGDADASYIVAKVEGQAGIEGDPMPSGTDMWEADKVARLRAWIDAGALQE